MYALSLVISMWIILFFIFVGFGLFIRRLSGIKTRGAKKLLESFWIGWVFAIFLLQLWHLYFRIDWRVFALVSMASILGLFWNYKELWLLVNNSFSKGWLCIVLLLTLLWLANKAILPQLIYDSGLYHFNSVRWATSFPIVPGLGNLHGRLASNSSYFLYVAFLEIGPLVHKSNHIANGLLLFALLTQIYISAYKLLKKSNDLQLYHIFNLLILFPVLNVDVRNIASPSPDLAFFILVIVASAQLVAFLEESKNSDEAEWAIFLVTTLAIFGLTVTHAFFVFGVSTLLLVFIVWFKRIEQNNKLLNWILISIVIGLIPWMIRGVILSGYIAYPFPIGSFPVKWRIPYESVVNMKNWILGFSRIPNVHWNKVLGNWNWIRPWTIRTFSRYDIKMPIFFTLIGCILVLFFRTRKMRYPETKKLIWLCLLPPLISLLCWFITIPDPRFGSVFFWILGVTTITIAAGYSDNNGLRNITKFYIILLLLLQIIPKEGKINFVKVIIKERNITKAFKQLQIGQRGIIKREGGNVFYDIPRAELKMFTTDSGLVVYVPKEKDQCWDAPLPCTPYPNAHLRLRKNGDMRYGFIVDLKDAHAPDIGIRR